MSIENPTQKTFNTRKYFDDLKQVIDPAHTMSDKETWEQLKDNVKEMTKKMTKEGVVMKDNMGFDTSFSEAQKVNIKGEYIQESETKEIPQKGTTLSSEKETSEEKIPTLSELYQNFDPIIQQIEAFQPGELS